VVTGALLEACKAQDRAAQRQLYDYMAPKLYYSCKRYLQHQSDIEEIMSDAFYTIFTKLEQLKEVGAFEAWARKITVNLCLSHIRKKGNNTIALEDAPINQTPQVSAAYMDKVDLLKLLNLLPEGCRMVFNLFAIEGYSHKEIAALLNISEGTSKSQLHFSKTKLKDLVGQYYFQQSHA
jgi:RNA polymerase sigma factor (sigma-70 family)